MDYDVIILGAATSGAYIAKKLASRGFSVLMLEALSTEQTGTRMDIFHVSQQDMETFDIPHVQEGDPEFAFSFTDNHFGSPSNKYIIPTRVQTIGLHMHGYVMLMIKAAEEAGAKVQFEAKFKEFYFEKGVIAGVRFETKEGLKELSCSLVIDCSGSKAAGRCALPKGYGVENFSLGDDDKFYVILRYMKFSEPKINNFWLNTKSWYAPYSQNPCEKIIGTGATGSYFKAEQAAEKLDMTTLSGEYELIRTEKGTTPYRRPPYSLVADNFVVTGDASCLTKPDCGEGVTSSMVMMDIAAEVITEALKKGDTSAEALWKINTEYNKKQGADFSLVRAFLTKVAGAKDEELEYCFEKGIIFTESFLNGGALSLNDILYIVKGIAGGVSKKCISSKTISSVLSGVAYGVALRTLYMNFPASPDGLCAWAKKCDALWKKVGKMS